MSVCVVYPCLSYASMQIATFLRSITLSCVVCLSVSTTFSHIISQTARFSEKIVIEHKMGFDFLCKFWLKHFLS